MKPNYYVPEREPRKPGVFYVFIKPSGNRGIREHFASMRRIWRCVDCQSALLSASHNRS